jgi:hypothetical protein
MLTRSNRRAEAREAVRVGGPSRATGTREGTADAVAGRRPSRAAYVVPAVLVVVALTQAVLTQTLDLTPWKGGGMGMFASVDRGDHRAVRAFLVTDDGEVPAVLSGAGEAGEALVQPTERARNLPDGRALDALARRLGAQEWVVDDSGAVPVAVLLDDAVEASELAEVVPVGAPLEVEAVRLEVWKLQFDADGVEITPTQLAAVERDVP